jgi:hypothetical protein
MSVWAAVLSLDGKTMVESRREVAVTLDASDEKAAAQALQSSRDCGEALGHSLVEKGASEMLALTRRLVGTADHHVAPAVTSSVSEVSTSQDLGAEEARRGKKRTSEEPLAEV